MPTYSLPCLHCNRRFEFRFPDKDPKFKYCCPKCKAVFRAEPGETVRRHAEGQTWLPGRGLVSVVTSAVMTYAHFDLRFRPDGKPERQVAFFALNPLTKLNFIDGGDRIALIYKGDTQVAAVNLTEDDWILTRSGGAESIKAMFGIGGEKKP